MAKIQREHDAREVELRKAQEHYESVKKSAGPSAECAHAAEFERVRLAHKHAALDLYRRDEETEEKKEACRKRFIC